MKLHSVFHVSLLREYRSDGRHTIETPHTDFIDGETHFQMESIVGERRTGRNKLTQFLVRWKGTPEESWQYESRLLEDAPKFAQKLINKFRKVKDSRKKNKPTSSK